MIETIKKTDVKARKSRMKGTQSGRYREVYWEAIEPHVPWLREQVEKEGTVIIKVDDMKKALGPRFTNIDWTTIFTGLKYVLWHYDMTIKSGTHKDNSKIFFIRAKVNGDILSDTLAALDNK